MRRDLLMAGPASEMTVEEVRVIAAAMLSEVTAGSEAMLRHLVALIPQAGEDEEIQGLTLGSCSSNLEAALSMLRHGVPASAAEAPVLALEHARAMAARGHSVDVMLRFYRLGHAWFIDRLLERVGEVVDDERQALRAVAQVERFAFTYIDRISSQVAAEYVAELDRRQNRARALRMDAVRALLAGETVDLERVERTLAHRVREAQTAFVCWSARSDVDMARVGQRLAVHLGAEHALLVPDGAQAMWGWVAGGTGALDEAATLAWLGSVGGAVHVVLGESQRGSEAFASSHRQALRARRVIELSGRPAPTVTPFAQVALVDALTQDLQAARALVTAEFGALAIDGPRERDERAALLALLDHGGGFAAAAAQLGLHRNTVLQRVRRAEERRGRPADERRLELQAALLLAQTIGPSVLASI